MWQLFCLEQGGTDLQMHLMSGSNDGGSCANQRTLLPQDGDHKFIGWFVTFIGVTASIAK